MLLCICLQAGEFWWKVQMTATTGGQEQLPLMTAALGRHATTTITVTNPLATEATFTTTSSAPRLFSVSPASMVLAAYDSTEVQLEYRPSSMGVFEEGVITVNGQEAGTVEYICQGQVSHDRLVSVWHTGAIKRHLHTLPSSLLR